MFESLGERLQNAIKKIKGYGKITEDNISEVTREIRLALLEADVNYKVVKEFIEDVKTKALGEEVKASLNPGEVFVKILKDELVELLGGDKEDLKMNGNPTILMLVGLQGSGKTTTIGKLANLLRKKYKKKPLLVACDIYRPAAIDQLKQLGKELNIEVYEEGKNNPVETSKNAIKYAKENNYDYVLIDVDSHEKLKSFNVEKNDKNYIVFKKITGKTKEIVNQKNYQTYDHDITQGSLKKKKISVVIILSKDRSEKSYVFKLNFSKENGGFNE